MNKQENKDHNRRPRHNQKDRNKQGSPRRNNNFIEFSIIIPLLNEEESLPELALELEHELEQLASGNYEVIFVDDGSTDDSYKVIKQINNRNKRFKAIRFRRNYGKSAALSVGFAQARGKYVATLDADLQDDPKELKNMYKKLQEGYDMVSGWKKKRYDPITKTLPSKLFNKVVSMSSGLNLHDFNSGIKLYKKDVIKTVQIYGEMHRFIPALAHWEGFMVAEVPVQHHARRYGKTKFGLNRFTNGFLDFMTVSFVSKYMKRPLHFFGFWGTLFTILGVGINSYLTIEWFLGRTNLSNRPLTLLGILLIIVGVQFISMGLLGEMITKHTMSTKKNNYSILERL